MIHFSRRSRTFKGRFLYFASILWPHFFLICAISLTTLLIMCCGSETSQDVASPKTLPMSAAILVAKAEAEIVKVRTALVESLKKAQADATKKGDLDGALSIKAKIEQVSGDLPAKAAPPVHTVSVQKATWGGEIGGPTTRDVTTAFNTALAQGPVTLQNTLFGFDPAPNASKVLTITYTKAGGRTVTKTFPENSIVSPDQLDVQ